MESTESKEFWSRILIAFLLVPVMILAVVLGGLYFFIFTLALANLAFIEIANMAQHAGFAPAKWVGLLAVNLILLGVYLGWALDIPILTGLWISSLFWARDSASTPQGFLGRLASTYVGVLYAGVLLGHLILIRNLPQGQLLVLVVLFGTWVADTGAYFVGKRWGKHKLMVTVSPGKTLEGAIGGGLLSWVVIMLSALMFGFQPIIAIGLSLSVPFAVVIGDLTISALKRSVGVKDTGTLLAGHGGVLDRIDGLAFALIVAYYFMVVSKLFMG